ncbi:MAG TPA: TlpA disulfide reductase family protein [Candidatus Baltobacteraceae bacterium]|nr:TlpA disulfide reductase family protein [Candidatus Baltobacteraceae bacterium]
MNQRVLAVLSAVVILALIVAGVLYARHASQLQNASTAPVNAAAEMGQKAPEFAIPSTAGYFDLAKVKKPVFLEIFATWCPHCQHETVVLNQLYAAYGSRVAFIAIPGSDTAMDGSSPESQFDVLNFQIRFKVKYPIGAYDPNLTVAKLYLKGGYPTIAIIDRNKTITYLNSGEVPYQELASALNAALK